MGFHEGWMRKTLVLIYSIFIERDVREAPVDVQQQTPDVRASTKIFIVHFLASIHRYDVTCYMFSSASMWRIKGNTWRSLFLRLWMISLKQILFT